MSENIIFYTGLFGSSGSGKTSIRKRFLKNIFNPNEISTLGADFGIGTVKVVFDKEYNLLGTVNRQDIIRGLKPESLMEILLDYRMKLLGGKPDKDMTEKSLF